MSPDEANALSRIVSKHGKVNENDTFDDGDGNVIIAANHIPGYAACVHATGRCVFAGAATHCPCYRVESRVVNSCASSDGNPRIANFVFVPKMEYLTWKLTQS